MPKILEPKEGGFAAKFPRSSTQSCVDSTISREQDKNLPVIPNDIFLRLDPFHRAAAEVLAKHGRLIIEPAARGVRS